MAGAAVPLMGLGTWLRTGEDGLRALIDGIAIGYRHLDTAQSYGTEENVGRAVRASGVPREDFFIVTKVADTNLARRDFLPSLRRSLDIARLDRFDMTLIHWPSHRDGVPFEVYMTALAEAKAEGLTRLIGVSNYTISLIERSVALLGPGEIATNQVELHPYLQSHRLAAACRAHGVQVTAYMPLAKGRAAGDPVLQDIGAAHGVGAAAAALAWLMQKGIAVIPASGKPEHMRANFAATGILLSEEEVRRVDTLDRGDRIVDPAKAPAWDVPP